MKITDLEHIQVSSSIISVATLCLLMLGYRRSGAFLNSLSQSETTKFIIATSITTIVITSIDMIYPLLITAVALMSISAYLSSLARTEDSGSESRIKLYLLLAVSLALVLFYCSTVLAAVMVEPTRATIEPQSSSRISLQPLGLDPDRELNRLVCLRKVRDQAIHEVSSRIIDGSPFALMDFPLHLNLGDNMIWHGTQTIFEIRGQFPIVTDPDQSKWGQNITIAKTLIKDGVIMCQGGGNFGDVWRGATTFRHNAVGQFKDNPVIFLPQSISYSNMTNVKVDNVTFQANKKTLFMFRDHTSLQFSLDHFAGKRAVYVPDLAFGLGPQTPNTNPVVDIVLLLRVDKEKIVKVDQKKEALRILTDAKVSFEVWDFPVLGLPLKLEKDNKTAVYNYSTIYPKQNLKMRHPTRHAFMSRHTQMANNVFSRGRLIITDRLHASIMSTLMGKPLIYLDNSYKKITNVRGALMKEFSECTDENLHARHVESLQQAAELALKILDGSVKM